METEETPPTGQNKLESSESSWSLDENIIVADKLTDQGTFTLPTVQFELPPVETNPELMALLFGEDPYKPPMYRLTLRSNGQEHTADVSKDQLMFDSNKLDIEDMVFTCHKYHKIEDGVIYGWD